VIDLEPSRGSVAIFRTGIMLAVVGAILISANIFYYTLVLQVSASILWAAGIVCIGMYLYKRKGVEQTVTIPHLAEERKIRVNRKPRVTDRDQGRKRTAVKIKNLTKSGKKRINPLKKVKMLHVKKQKKTE